MASEQGAELRAILASIPDALIVISERGVVRSFNGRAESLFDCTADMVLGQNISTLLTDGPYLGSHAGIVDFWSRPRADQAANDIQLLTLRRQDGSEIHIEVRFADAVIDGERSVICFFRDQTERIAIESRLSDLKDELAQVSRISAMAEMAAGLAHELNQPLAATTNFLAAAERLLENVSDAARVVDLLRMAQDQTLRAGQIIRGLRDLVAKRDVDLQEESLADMTSEAIALIRPGSARFGITISQSIEDEAATVFGDRIQIQQVLVALLNNAVQSLRAAQRGERKIAIIARGRAGMVEICITGTGPGIAELAIEQLDAPFAFTKDVDNPGFGLSICRRIVEAHGGQISAENWCGGGALFRFTLPSGNGGREEAGNDALHIYR